MAVQDAKIKNIAKDLITGIGGLRIKDVIGNFRKGPAVKVLRLPTFKKKVKKIFFFFHLGKLFYLDTDEGGTGCHCKPEWNVYYWNQTQECFEQESPGPCPSGQYFAYNSTSRSTECNCFKNYVFDPAQGTCIEQFTVGPCPDGYLVVEDENGRMKCDCGPHMKAHYWIPDGKCYPHYQQGTKCGNVMIFL